MEMNTRRGRWLLVLVSAAVLLGGSFGAVAEPAAQLGAIFAETYSAFAPLFSFYQSFADHLFQGSAVEIPGDVATACGGFAEELAYLHLEIQIQTASQSAFSMPALLHLRSDAAAFCATFGPTLVEISAWIEVDAESLRLASADGLFIGISELNAGLDRVFTEVFDGFASEESRWRFAVTFAVRAVLVSEGVKRLNANLNEIFYGDSDADAPPIPVPEAVEEAMAVLVERSGQELLAEDEASVLTAARIVYEHFSQDSEETPANQE